MSDLERIINTFNVMIKDINTNHSNDNGSIEYKQFQMIKKGLDDIIINYDTIEDIKKRILKDNKGVFWRQPEFDF